MTPLSKLLQSELQQFLRNYPTSPARRNTIPIEQLLEGCLPNFEIGTQLPWRFYGAGISTSEVL